MKLFYFIFSRIQSKLCLLYSIKHSDEWITTLKWSIHGTYLAYAESNGTVRVMQVIDNSDQFQTQQMKSPYLLDPRCISILYWVSNEILAIGKANTVCFWNILECTTKEVMLPSCTLISAMSLTADKLGLHVFTMDSHMYFIDFLDEEYVIDAVESRNLQALFLSKHQESVLIVNKNHDANAADEDHEVNAEEDDEVAPQKLNARVGRIPMFLGAAPSPNGLFIALFYGISRPFELYFRSEKNSALFLDFLTTCNNDFISNLICFPSLESSKNVKECFRPFNLGPRYLFWDYLAYFFGFEERVSRDSFRKNILVYFDNLADAQELTSKQCKFFLSKYIPMEEDNIGNFLLHHYFQDVFTKLQAVFSHFPFSQLRGDFLSFLFRFLALSKRITSASTIEQLQRLFPLEIPNLYIDSEWVINEKCPVCEKNMNMLIQNGVISGLCENSHSWKRCCFTFQLLDTSQVRECLGCGLTASFAISSTRDQETLDPCYSFLIQLKNTPSCYLCGDRFGWRGNPLSYLSLT
ncbi:hypothetical protein HMI55_000654 [Coelomomyces lativittatus]|nr:hypothetical protein HMI55_000654 [Coelomomyces lativittatus]